MSATPEADIITTMFEVKTTRVLALMLMACVVGYSGATTPLQKVGSFAYTHPSFLSVFPTGLEGSGSPALTLTSFQAFGSGSVSAIRSIGAWFNSSSGAPDIETLGSLSWPNQMTLAPASALDASPALVLGDGFLVPGHSTGSVYAIRVGGGDPIALAPEKKEYFYHKAHLRDMDGDGDLDILTARGTKPVFGTAGGDLVWLRNPGGASPLDSAPWDLTTISSKGCDFELAWSDMDAADDVIEVWCPSFFSQELVLHVVGASNGSLITSRVIDSGLPLESIGLVDLDADGKDEIVVNSHSDKPADSVVLAYEIPPAGSLLSGSYVRHVLASGFNTTEGGFGPQASPGFVTPVFPTTTPSSSERPLLVVAGDGAQSGFLLVPAQGSKWDYTLELIVDVHGVVGIIAAGDVNLDGYTDLFIPDYDSGVIYAYTFAP